MMDFKVTITTTPFIRANVFTFDPSYPLLWVVCVKKHGLLIIWKIQFRSCYNKNCSSVCILDLAMNYTDTNAEYQFGASVNNSLQACRSVIMSTFTPFRSVSGGETNPLAGIRFAIASIKVCNDAGTSP